MTVLDRVREFEQQVVSRLQELEPLTQEYEELRAAAQRLGLEHGADAGNEAPRAAASRGRGSGRRRPGATGRGQAKKPASGRRGRAGSDARTTKPPGRGARPSSRATKAPTTGARRSSRATDAATDDAQRTRGRGPARRGQRQDDVLRLVVEQPGTTVRAIAERLEAAPSGLYRVVNRLSSAGLVRKDGPRIHPAAETGAPEVPPPAVPDQPATSPSDRSEAPDEPRQAELSTQDRGGTYVYGVVPAEAELDALTRTERLPDVWLIEVGELAAIVSDAAAGDDATMRQAAQAHPRVLAAAAHDAPVVPLRSGIVYPSDEAVRDQLLEPLGERLAELVKTSERGVQATPTEDAALAEILAGETEVARLREAI